MKNFFISYNKADKEWSKWLDWALRSLNYSTFVQFNDIPWGANFIVGMDKGLKNAERVILIVSPDSLASGFVDSEWSVAKAKDPDGTKGLLLPIKISACKPEGLLSVQVYLDLVGKDEATATNVLKEGLANSGVSPNGEGVGHDPKPPYPLCFDFAVEYVDSEQELVNALIAKLEAKNKRVYRELWKVSDGGVPVRAKNRLDGIVVECRVVCAGNSTPADWAEARTQAALNLQDLEPNLRFVPVVFGTRLASLRDHFPQVRFWADSTNAQALLLGTQPEAVPTVAAVDEVTAVEERAARFLKFMKAQEDNLDPAVRKQAQQELLDNLMAYVRP